MVLKTLQVDQEWARRLRVGRETRSEISVAVGLDRAMSVRAATLRDMPKAPTPDDYAWFESGNHLAYYTLMFARGLTPDEALRRLAAPEAVMLCAYEPELGDPDQVDARDLGEWALVVERNGFVGSVETAVNRLSIGTEVVMLTFNVLAHCRFRHVVDGETWTDFDAVDPSERYGLHPDRLVDEMRRIGLDPEDRFDEMNDPGDFEDFDDESFNWQSKTMALAESVTGSRVTPETFSVAPSLTARIHFSGGR